MDKIEVYDFSSWVIYDGFPEGSGRSEKIWLKSPEGNIGLFKWPKTNTENGHITYEHISEHFAYQIGNLLNIPTADVEIGIYNKRIGSLSKLINKPDEEICEGASYIVALHPKYDLNKLYDFESDKYYSVDNIFEVSESETEKEYWIDMMFFDYLIGNSDRHQNNWAFLLSSSQSNEEIETRRPCPLYDNGSSLCCYIDDNDIETYFGNDRRRIEALVNTKSLSLIRIDPANRKKPLHSDVIRYLLRKYTYSSKIAERIISIVSGDNINELIHAYPDEIFPQHRKRLLSMYLTEKVRMLAKLRGECKNER